MIKRVIPSQDRFAATVPSSRGVATAWGRWLGLTVAWGGILAGGRSAPAQPELSLGRAARPEANAVNEAWSNDPRMVACGNCHFNGPSENPLARVRRPGEFSRQTEMRIWLTQDVHAEARRRIEPWDETRSATAEAASHSLTLESGKSSLTNSHQLSRQICDALGYDVTKEEGYARFRDNCLTCHGGWSPTTPQPGFSRTGYQQPGLSCQHCHQLGDDDAWVDQHWQATQWRLLTPAEKQAAGLRDLVSMAAQSQWCADCHLGNIEKHQFVTHAMYAAGHPPLPAFEVQSYCQQMPQHWQDPAGLYESLAGSPDRETYFAVSYPSLFSQADHTGQTPTLAWTMRKLLTGAIQSERQGLRYWCRPSRTTAGGITLVRLLGLSPRPPQ